MMEIFFCASLFLLPVVLPLKKQKTSTGTFLKINISSYRRNTALYIENYRWNQKSKRRLSNFTCKEPQIQKKKALLDFLVLCQEHTTISNHLTNSLQQ
jgi:hypothetical protein